MSVGHFAMRAMTSESPSRMLRSWHHLGDEHRDGQVDGQSGRDGRQRAEGQGPRRVLQVARHAEPGFDARHGGKEHGEGGPERQGGKTFTEHALVAGRPARKQRPERRNQQGQDEELALERQVGRPVGQAREHDQGRYAQRHRGQIGEVANHDLREAGHVEGDTQGLGQEQRQTDGRTDLEAERPGDHVVRAAAADLHVGRHGGDRESGQERDRDRQRDDEERPAESHAADDPRQAQIHDHTENREDARRVDPLERAEPVAGDGWGVLGVWLGLSRCLGRRCRGHRGDTSPSR